MLRPMMQQIIREEVRKVLEGQDVSKINREMPTEVDLMEEEPLRMDQTMRQNVVDAISAFARAVKKQERYTCLWQCTLLFFVSEWE